MEHSISAAFVVSFITILLIGTLVFLDNDQYITGAVVAEGSSLQNKDMFQKGYTIYDRAIKTHSSIKSRESCEGCIWGNNMVLHISGSASVFGFNKDNLGGIAYFKKNDLAFEKKPSFYAEENTCVSLGSSLAIISYKGKSSSGSLRCVEKAISKGWQFNQ